MFAKTFIIIIVLVAGGMAAGVGDIRKEPAAAVGVTAPRSYSATVDVNAMRVISYLDEQGVEHAPDSTLIPPVPLHAVREFTVIVAPRRMGSTPVASGIEPR